MFNNVYDLIFYCINVIFYCNNIKLLTLTLKYDVVVRLQKNN